MVFSQHFIMKTSICVREGSINNIRFWGQISHLIVFGKNTITYITLGSINNELMCSGFKDIFIFYAKRNYITVLEIKKFKTFSQGGFFDLFLAVQCVCARVRWKNNQAMVNFFLFLPLSFFSPCQSMKVSYHFFISNLGLILFIVVCFIFYFLFYFY